MAASKKSDITNLLKEGFKGEGGDPFIISERKTIFKYFGVFFAEKRRLFKRRKSAKIKTTR
jgi:hypothetical protein